VPSCLRASRRAFTLTEILIVIGLMVLLLAIAVPAFNLIRGGRSVEGAQNQISAMLGRARAQAIGLQKTTGVLFFIEPRSKQVNMAIVSEVDAPSNLTSTVAQRPAVYLDLDGSDFLPLPAGVGVQTIDDAVITGTPPVRQDDGYLGFNASDPNKNVVAAHGADGAAITSATIPFGGVILFDGSGRLISTSYGFLTSTGTNPVNAAYTAIGRLLFGALKPNGAGALIPGAAAAGASGGLVVRSQLGLALFEHDLFVTAGGADDDPQITVGTVGSYSAAEKAEEQWLDQNAVLLLINRYTGTLVKGQ
jgi:prepilin-type N-terminal cleavage/methylation domain-containing protein